MPSKYPSHPSLPGIASATQKTNYNYTSAIPTIADFSSSLVMFVHNCYSMGTPLSIYLWNQTVERWYWYNYIPESINLS